MKRSTSSFLNNYENMINILSIESKYSIQVEKDTTLEQNLLWRRRQPLYKSSVNSSTTSFESLISNSTDDSVSTIENKYQYQFECPNAMASKNSKITNLSLNEKLAELRKHFS